MRTQRWIVSAMMSGLLVVPAAAQHSMGSMGSMGGAQTGAMGAPMGAMPDMAGMLQRSAAVLQHAEHMAGGMQNATPNAMPMEHGAGDPMQTMTGHLHTMASGLHGLLQQMDAMQKSGMTMDAGAHKDWMAMQSRASVLLGDMEKTMQAMHQLQTGRDANRP